ncbi:MAG: TetR/AcrR family transcriptional regulator [Dehalococcoidia bacterium]|nr:TetR/AcrR family transcriptional regulator [Dehalococcoidia bacterium]
MVTTRARRLPAEKRKRQIIESARSVFAGQTYAKVGTADLAKAAGISEPALYRHFAGKKELFVATLRATAPRLLRVWEEISCDYDDPIETLWAIGVYYYDHLDSHTANMKLQFRALSEADDPEIRAALRESFGAFVEFVADTLEEGKARGIVREDVDARIVAWQFLGIGMTLDMMHVLGFSGEMDRARAAIWGRLYLDAVKRTAAGAPTYLSDRAPMRAPDGIWSALGGETPAFVEGAVG